MATAEMYYQAALEHIDAAFDLHQRAVSVSSGYVLSHYVSGLAVECMLRAYRLRIDPAFDSRHNLTELFRLSGFGNIIPIGRENDYSDIFSEITDRWSNNHRYLSEQGLRSLLKKSKMDRGIKGDFLKESSRRIVNAAHDFVQLGKDKWMS